MLSEGKMTVDNMFTLKQGMSTTVNIDLLQRLFHAKICCIPRDVDYVPGQGSLRASRSSRQAIWTQRQQKAEAKMGYAVRSHSALAYKSLIAKP